MKKIITGKPAEIVFKEKTELVNEFGNSIKGVIRDFLPVFIPTENEEYYPNRSPRVLLVTDSWGNNLWIPFDWVESIIYK